MTISDSELDSTVRQMDTTSCVAELHVHIFALGLLIRLLRSTTNWKPSELLIYTKALFKGVAAFQKVANTIPSEQSRFCSPTLWPVFHAAVELYRLEDQAYAREVWLDDIEKTAIGNRKHVQRVVERVWLVRNLQASALSNAMSSRSAQPTSRELAAGQIVIDWTEIVKDMGLDLLLI